METKDIHIGDTVIFNDCKEHVKGYVLYIDEGCNDQSAYFVEISLNPGNRFYNGTEVKINWETLLPKSILKQLDIDKGYLWIDRSQILHIYSELEHLIEDINEELSK